MSPKCPPLAKKKSHPSGPAAVSDIANAICEVAESFGNNFAAAGNPTTLKRRTKAIRLVGKVHELDARECIKAIHLFKRDIAAADAYLAIDELDVHAEFICLKIGRDIDAFLSSYFVKCGVRHCRVIVGCVMA